VVVGTVVAVEVGRGGVAVGERVLVGRAVPEAVGERVVATLRLPGPRETG
jgi:hypothetical protein